MFDSFTRSRFVRLLLAGSLCTGAVAFAQNVPILVPNGTTAPTGATLVATRGSYSVYELSAAARRAGALPAGITERPDFLEVMLHRGTINTGNAPAQRSAAVGTRRLKIVQFPAPPTDTDLKALEAEGMQIVQYVPQNAYLVWAPGTSNALLARNTGNGQLLRFAADYEPLNALSPALDDALLSEGKQTVVVQVANYKAGKGEESAADVAARIGKLGAVQVAPTEMVFGKFINLTVRVSGKDLASIVAEDAVVWVEPVVKRERHSESQAQTMAGNVENGAPTGPGYLAWLTGKGFPTTPAEFPVVVIVDDGVDNGTTGSIADRTMRVGGETGGASRVVFNRNVTAATTAITGKAGHGHINANIAGGLDPRTDSFATTTGGYKRGTGIAPYTRLASTKIFLDDGTFDISAVGDTDAGLLQSQWTDGAGISSNSWGSNVGGAYDSTAQAFDAGTRDASSTDTGNQELLLVVSAGNAGAGANTIGSPGTAKNVITVGATEGNDDQGVTDGCGTAEANNINDIIGFSSRGPTDDGRIKPDVVGPGTHVVGTATPVAGYDGTGVCNQYYPTGQTTYNWSSGTSHSTPAVAGFTSLIANYLKREHGFGAIRTATGPSPALIKAYLTHSARVLTGGVGTTSVAMPSNNQGWGFPNGNEAFDNTVTRFIRDQQTVLGDSGQSVSYTGTVTSSAPTLRVALAWTDAPGAISGNSWVNDLDLTVTVGTAVYKGNVLSTDGISNANTGTADTRNNLEVVTIPGLTAGQPITISVNGTTIVGDGVPGNGDNTDQDFALVVSNMTYSPSASFTGDAIIISDVGGNGNSNGAADPGESALSLTIPVNNVGEANATGVVGTLVSMNSNVTIVDGSSSYDTINAGSQSSNSQAFVVSISEAATCGASIPFELLLTADGGVSRTVMLDLPIGRYVSAGGATVAATGLPLSIPDGVGTNPVVPGVRNHALTVSGVSGTVSKVRLTGLSITHTWVSDIEISLFAPGGTSVLLTKGIGGNGDNFTGTTFDDAASVAISAGSAPFAGTFQPASPLSAFNGISPNGTWTLRVTDNATGDVGSLLAWTLNLETETPVCDAPASSGDDVYDIVSNDSLADARMATPLLVNSPNSNLVLLDPDWYRITLPECENAKFTISFDNSQGNINAQLWEATCSDLGGLYRLAEAYSPDASVETFTYVNKGAANLFLEVYGEGGVTNPNYSVTIDSLGTDDTFEPNNDPGFAVSLPTGVQHTDLVCKDDDIFRITIPAGMTLMDVNVSANFNRGQLYWQVLEDNGTYNVINGGASSYYVPNQLVMEQTGMPTGGRSTVLLRVYGATGGSNFYNLRVNVQ